MIARRIFLSLAAAALAPLRAQAARAAVAAIDPLLAAAIASPTRTPGFAARDRYRHPADVLAFFGLLPTQTVIEIDPAPGYWTEILAPYLKPHGRYIAALPLPDQNAEARKSWQDFVNKLAANPPLYGAVIMTGIGDGLPIAPPGTADLILSFRNLHDWMADGTTQAKLAAIHAALKPGGVLGIEDHRGLSTQKQDPLAKSGYVREDYATALITAAGFVLAGSSAINHNPRDTKSYPKGVWTLPPTLALGQTDRAKYLAIGESDRWTLKFTKPV
jgi:predicted methyltransferase